MLIWSKVFETKIESVDQQHKNLFDLLNKLVKNIEDSNINNEDIDQAINLLIHYTKTNFHDEELLMEESRVDSRHLFKHRMEHKSFLYDVEHFSELASFEDRRMTGKVAKLIRFITFWLTFHILGSDLIMAAQIANIKLGMTPKIAFETVKDQKLEPTLVYMMLDAVMNLWNDAKNKCNQLEKKNRELEKKLAALEVELQIQSIKDVTGYDDVRVIEGPDIWS